MSFRPFAHFIHVTSVTAERASLSSPPSPPSLLGGNFRAAPSLPSFFAQSPKVNRRLPSPHSLAHRHPRLQRHKEFSNTQKYPLDSGSSKRLIFLIVSQQPSLSEDHRREWELQIDGGELAGVSRLMNTMDDEMGSVGQERERWSFNWTLVSCRQRPTFT